MMIVFEAKILCVVYILIILSVEMYKVYIFFIFNIHYFSIYNRSQYIVALTGAP